MATTKVPQSKKTQATYEETLHYNGEASVKFYPGNHGYFVTDNFVRDGEEITYKNQRMGGGTSITGMLAKGQGLMLYPMYEMKKYLKKYFQSTTVEEFIDAQFSLEDLLKDATQAHVRKSDRGKSVGTDAHAWVEAYVRECMRVQDELGLKSIDDVGGPAIAAEYAAEFKLPEIPTVEELGVVLRASYIAIFKASKPTDIEGYRKLAKSILADADIQDAIHIEATMLHKSTTAAKEWFDLHDVFVHGTEDTIYSRKYGFCGKYDIDMSVRCTEKCGWCYLNMPLDKAYKHVDEHEQGADTVYSGRYMVDFKSTNSSTEAPKGIYKEYLIQCAVYELGKIEEFPDIKYAGYLIFNGSKNEPKRDKDGNPISLVPGRNYTPFNTHYSFSNERSRQAVKLLVELREIDYAAKQEMKASA